MNLPVFESRTARIVALLLAGLLPGAMTTTFIVHNATHGTHQNVFDFPFNPLFDVQAQTPALYDTPNDSIALGLGVLNYYSGTRQRAQAIEYLPAGTGTRWFTTVTMPGAENCQYIYPFSAVPGPQGTTLHGYSKWTSRYSDLYTEITFSPRMELLGIEVQVN